MAVKSTAISVRVQRDRIALTSDQPFSLAEALETQADALALREEMVAMGRWSESGRLLMLAADVSGMLRDLEGAEKVLRRALPEEVAAGYGPLVFGEAALRGGAPRLALELPEPPIISRPGRSIARRSLCGHVQAVLWERSRARAAIRADPVLLIDHVPRGEEPCPQQQPCLVQHGARRDRCVLVAGRAAPTPTACTPVALLSATVRAEEAMRQRIWSRNA